MLAYVSLLFGSDKYLPGVKTLFSSLQRTNTPHALVCMVTHDVPLSALTELEGMGVTVVCVPYVEVECQPMRTKKQAQRYSQWIHLSLTKWRCLQLTQWSKVLFMDADLVVLKNIDSLFELPAPAGVWKYGYKDRAHIQHQLRHGFVVDGSLVLLNTSDTAFKHLLAGVKSLGKPFGFGGYAGFDEQAVAWYYSVYHQGPKLPWAQIDVAYSYSWQPNMPPKKDSEIYVRNFIGDPKPWVQWQADMWPDTQIFYKAHATMALKYGCTCGVCKLRGVVSMKKLVQVIPSQP